MNTQYLISLPPRMAAGFAALEHRNPPDWFAGHDPAGAPLGSGGGTVHLLVEAWRAEGCALRFEQWLRQRRRLVLHAGGLSRRLPAYAATGKALAPVPVFRWARGQPLDQTLLDLQIPRFERILRHADRDHRVLVASGDVLPLFDTELPTFPNRDILGLGMACTPEVAKDFGVFFTPGRHPDQLAFFLQKPAPGRIRELSADHLFLIDTGLWLLGERAVLRLMEKCGWRADRQDFESGSPSFHDLYGQLGPALGSNPSQPDAFFADLTSGVVPLPRAEFHHFGTSRQMVAAVSDLQSRALEPGRIGAALFPSFPTQHLQNSRVAAGIHRENNSNLWIENSHVPAGWTLAKDHVLTGVPENGWTVRLEPGVCLDFVPTGSSACVIRAYGFDDRFDGLSDDPRTRWLGRPFPDWFTRRNLDPVTAGIRPGTDIFDAPLFPEVEPAGLDGTFLEWLFASQPEDRPDLRDRWLTARRLSARALASEIDLDRLYQQRARLRTEGLLTMLRHRDRSVIHRLDLQHSATLYATTAEAAPEIPESEDDLGRVHAAMFRASILRQRGTGDWKAEEQRAFEILRETLVREAQVDPVLPRTSVVEDQIVWARSPVRLDLAGGWTDTPPFCLEHGGQVVNAAIDINGQPPIQVFARLCSEPRIVLRSIDQGLEEPVHTYAELDRFSEPGNSFALAKAACALAGFLPRFHRLGGYGSLERDLAEFGGGLELTLLSAVPKGSGLGTSSILAATLLGALSEVAGLGWDHATLFARTLALEQLVTTGGGWQDQAGGLFPGLKLIETSPGLAQIPRVRWLPSHLFAPASVHGRMLLYYTGITRLAKNILAEIVRGIFLNSPRHLDTLERIAGSARSTVLAIEHRDYLGLAESIDLTWQLKQEIDSGTNPPAVQQILDAVREDLLAAALPGAGGGGYLLMLAKDDSAGNRIRRKLEAHPPNPRARFVDFGLSEVGLQITRS